VKNNAAKNTRLIVIGNKIDLLSEKIEDSQGEVSYESAQGYCKSIGAELKLTSAKNSKGIDELFDTVATKGNLAAEEIHKDEE
jgi:Ras-related protein Rab-22